MARKRKSPEDDLLNMLLELSGVIWQLGAVVTFFFMFFALVSFRWARHSIAAAESSPLLAQLAATYGWVLFVLPILFMCLTLIFGKKTLDGYFENGQL